MNLICADGTMSTGSIIMWVVLIVALLFMLIFPSITQKKRNKEYEQMLSGIRVGDTVRTAGGVIGRVVRITKKGEITTVTLETGTKSEKSFTEFDINFINCVLKSTRVEGTPDKQEIEVEEDEDEPKPAENKGDVSDVAPEKVEVKSEQKAEEKVEEPAKKTRAKSAVKKTTTKKSAKK